MSWWWKNAGLSYISVCMSKDMFYSSSGWQNSNSLQRTDTLFRVQRPEGPKLLCSQSHEINHDNSKLLQTTAKKKTHFRVSGQQTSWIIPREHHDQGRQLVPVISSHQLRVVFVTPVRRDEKSNMWQQWRWMKVMDVGGYPQNAGWFIMVNPIKLDDLPNKMMVSWVIGLPPVIIHI